MLVRLLSPLIAIVAQRPRLTALLLALLLALPGALVPFMTDDHIHQIILEDWLGRTESGYALFQDASGPLGMVNLFTFFQDDPALNQAAIAAAEVPWWTHPEITITFWRPLSSATHLLDYVTIGRLAPAHHLHNIAWYLALVAAWGTLVRRSLPSTAAALATILFAIDEVHWLAVTWTANRNALIAATLGILGLLAHLRWREDGWKPGLPLSMLGFGAALLGGEAALGVFGYLGAYQLFGARGGLKSKAIGLAPGLLIGLVWAAFYKAMHFGAHGSGLYLDPTREPLAYLAAAITRVPTLLGSQLGGLPADLWLFTPPIRPVSLLYGVTCIAVAVWLLRRAWPTLAEGERRGLSWLIPGGLFALMPVLATFPLDRLLLLPSLAGSAVVAVCLRLCWRAWRDGGAASLKWMTLPVGAVHVVMAGTTWLSMSAIFTVLLAPRAAAVAEPLLAEDFTDQRVFVINGSDPLLSIYLPLMLVWEGRPAPDAWIPLTMAPFKHELIRTAPDRLEVALGEGRMLGSAFEQLTRRPENDPYQVGDVVQLDMLTIEILALDGVYPTRVGFTFEGPLEEERNHFYAWRDGALTPVTPPAVGETLSIPWSPGPMGL